MAQLEKAKVFMSGRSQAVLIPAKYRFSSSEVYIRRDPTSSDLILSQAPGSWEEIFATLDSVGVPDDFLTPADRAQLPVQERVEYCEATRLADSLRYTSGRSCRISRARWSPTVFAKIF